MRVCDCSLIPSTKNTLMRTFKEFGEFILQNSNHNQVPSDWVHIIVNYPKIEWDDWAEYMATITWFTGIPLRSGGSKTCHVIFAENIDEGLQHTEQYEHAIISYIGSYYYSVHGKNIHTSFKHFQEMGHPCRGHLLFHPGRQYGRLHPQTIFLNLQHWRSIGSPSFGPYTGKVLNYERSTSNVHDDYTPHWVKGSDGYRDVVDAEMAEYISKVLEDGKTILNFDVERTTKFFCYPERRKSAQLDVEINRNQNIIYAHNTERLKSHNSTKYDVIYSPASGYLAEFLYDTYAHKDTKLVIFDYNPDAIKWKQMIYTMASTAADLQRITKYFEDKGCIIDGASYKQDLVQNNVSVFSEEKWLALIQQIQPEFMVYNAITGTLPIDTSKRNLVYLSNIFSYNPVIHKYKIEHLHDKFVEYTRLPNTTVIGNNVFKDAIYSENHSS